MPDEDTTEAAEEQDESSEEQESDSANDQPAINPDEMADLSSVADEVEESMADESDESSESDTDEGGEDAPEEPEEAGADARTSIGDVYCNMLGMAAWAARDRYGDLDGMDRSEAMEQYADIAADLEIDAAVDDWIEQQGGPDALTPAQTVIIMSVVWGGIVVMDDPAILDTLDGEEAPEVEA